MRMPLLNPALVLLLAAAWLSAGCGDDGTGRIPCCGDDVVEPKPEGGLEAGQPVVADPTERADYLLDFGSAAVGETARMFFSLQNSGEEA